MGKIPLPAAARFAVAAIFAGTVLGAAQTPFFQAEVPADLRPLLVPRQSEMRLVVRRYTLDRQTLESNYAGSLLRIGAGSAFAGTGDLTMTLPAPAISTACLSRLKRFDLSWRAAIGPLDAATLSVPARNDRQGLLMTIEGNLAEIEKQARTLAETEPLVPFRAPLVSLVEARIKLVDVDPAAAARTLTAATREVTAIRSRVAATGISREAAAVAAQAVTLIRLDVAEWFSFYDGYDPQFTWWIGRPAAPKPGEGGPFAALNAALESYGAWLGREAPATQAAVAPVAAPPVAPSSPTKYPDVPDISELLRLPQDELIEIVRRFRGMHDGPGELRRPELYQRLLDALKTLDFASLSRNAQIDYLFIKRTSQFQIERATMTLPANPPRKTDDSGVTGAARGRQGLIRDLQDELIPYTPEELITLADRELAWVETEMKKASRELGFGDDWKRAVEHVKDMHPPPGGQPAAIRDLMFEAVDYLRQHDLLTVPAVAAESLHMVMLTPEQQLINPFFRGGPRISVSYPTDAMAWEQRVQSMRGNNTPFSHATAHHEMIPGHNLDDYYRARFDGYRAELVPRTPFFREGWALYWELLLWDRGFNDTPAERIGALFWRMHRCARITFSLKFHLGQWSPQEAVDFLVDRVGHERENAIAEVRRSFRGDYGPLYQAAYLLGGIQIRALYRELVESKRMTAKAFHDEMLRQNSMPIALLRLAVGVQPLNPETQLDWKFYGELR